MSVPIQTVQPGAVFRFKTANRRVVALSDVTDRGCMVRWAYADHKPRGGKIGGKQWVHYFRADAIERVPDDGGGVNFRILQPSGRRVPCLTEPVNIHLTTKCPAKWAVIDLETGEAWAHDDHRFKLMGQSERADVAGTIAHLQSVGSGASP